MDKTQLLRKIGFSEGFIQSLDEYSERVKYDEFYNSSTNEISQLPVHDSNELYVGHMPTIDSTKLELAK